MVGAVGRVSLVVRLARLEEILPLRHAVLRPGKPASAAVFDRDGDAVHIGAWDGEVLVGCATVFADPWAGADGYPAEPAAWRLRGMAVAPTRQGTGVGRQVLAAAVAAARDGSAPLIWANARLSALPFYAAAGFVAVGEHYLTAETGLPHTKILLIMSSTGSHAGESR